MRSALVPCIPEEMTGGVLNIVVHHDVVVGADAGSLPFLKLYLLKRA